MLFLCICSGPRTGQFRGNNEGLVRAKGGPVTTKDYIGPLVALNRQLVDGGVVIKTEKDGYGPESSCVSGTWP